MNRREALKNGILGMSALIGLDKIADSATPNVRVGRPEDYKMGASTVLDSSRKATFGSINLNNPTNTIHMNPRFGHVIVENKGEPVLTLHPGYEMEHKDGNFVVSDKDGKMILTFYPGGKISCPQGEKRPE